MKNKIYMVLALGIIVLLALNLILVGVKKEGTVTSSGIDLNTMACISKNNQVLGCYNNVYTGKEIVKACVGQGACSASSNIALCNATGGCITPLATWKNYTNEFRDCGMARAAGSFSNNSDTNIPGNYSIYYTFTSSCDNIVVNGTALHNATGDKINNTLAIVGFPNVTLQTNDQLTINWTIYTL